MANTIIIKKSSTASAVPAAGSLQPGELAVNLADKKLYSKTTGGTVIMVGAGGTMAAQDASSVAITGGTINGTVIGGTTAAAGTFTTLAGTTSLTTPLVTNAGTLALSATGANSITLATNGSEKARIHASGGVSIGNTTDPGAANLSVSGKVSTAASTTSAASLNLPHGAAPTTPSNGDVWTTTAGIYVRVNGTTVGPLGTGGTGSTTAFYENDITLSANYTLTSGKNGMAAGPITISSGITLTVPSGSTFTVV